MRQRRYKYEEKCESCGNKLRTYSTSKDRKDGTPYAYMICKNCNKVHVYLKENMSLLYTYEKRKRGE